jgi:NAD(P)-dependent dehydrogenase (short-subunit alcohol dehydrogenase family)
MKIDQNFVAVVTGGSSGLGLAAVKLLSSLGAKIVVADINDEEGTAVAKEAKGSFFKTNVTD